MKSVLASALIAALVAALVVRIERALDGADAGQPEPAAIAPSPLALSYTAELVEDGWVDAARTAGADHKPLARADNSICFLTKIEISGVTSADDTNSCRIEIDDFTGYWELWAEVDEGGRSQVRCNARCLVWN